jgi:hypothetical protein
LSQAELEEAQLLLRKAREDADAAAKLAADGDTADAIVGFHAQQAVEKALKAVLAASGDDFPESTSRVRVRDGEDDPRTVEHGWRAWCERMSCPAAAAVWSDSQIGPRLVPRMGLPRIQRKSGIPE